MRRSWGMVVLMLLCLGCGISEEERQQQIARERWWNSLTPEQQARVEAARLQALGMLMQNGGPFGQSQMVTPPTPLIRSTPTSRPCMSNVVGNQVYTYCN